MGKTSNVCADKMIVLNRVRFNVVMLRLIMQCVI